MKVSLLTLGCKANQAESSLIEASLRSHGCNIVQLNEKPDFCIVNTCSVTSKSDYQSRQLIRRAHNAGSSVIVTGCYSELNKDAVKAMEGVTMVIDNNTKTYLYSMLTGNTSCTTSLFSSSSKSRFFLKVQDGCNYSCSYCIIPKARGRSRSMSMDEVTSQIDTLCDTYSEVVLTGIHLGTYGYDLLPKVTLSDLLTMILLKTRIKRVRLSSLEVREIDEGLLDLMQEERVCKHFHIPLQSGDDTILKMMNRTYDSAIFFNSINRLLLKVPDISIGTDIIAGFPGEGDKEFENTRTFVESIPFSYVHVFPFSSRMGTSAYEMPSRVDSMTKKVRCSVLRELGARKKTGYMRRHLGRSLDLLIEEMDGDGVALGTTGNYLKVRAYVSDARVKDIVPVSVAGLDGDVLIGHPIAAI
jgi:threonylcarbamoyladenosine tRNA methylthiotransferase MtaB